MQKQENCQIDLDLYNRLLKVGVIKVTTNIQQKIENKQAILDSSNSQRLLNGIFLGQYLLVLKQMLAKLNQDLNISDEVMRSLNDQNTPQAKLFNWNQICSQLDKIGVIVENDIKSLYVAGDASEIQTLFKRIERFIIRISGEPDILEFKNFERDIARNQPSSNRGEANLDLLTKEANGRRGTQQVAQARIVKSGVDIMRMDTNKPVSESESTLEFILNTLCKALQLKPKQAAALLTNNNQFLSHCCIKGVKGAFEPMIAWYNDVFNNSRHLTQMLEIEGEATDQKGQQAAKQNFQKLLQTISCGCLSQNEEVARLCLKTLQSMGEDFSNNQVLNIQGITWFNDKTQGFDLISQTLKNHPSLGMEIVKSIAVFCKDANSLDQLYNINLMSKYLNPFDYIMIIKDLLSFMVSMHKEEELEQEFLPNIIEFCLRNSEAGYQNTFELRTASISLLSDLWLAFTNYLNDSQRQDVQNAILQTLQKNQRDKQANIRIVTIAHSFTLLEILASEKQAVAPTLYKQLIFSFVENPYDYTIRQIYLSNFQNLFEKNKQIPVALLIDPLLKSMQNQDTYTFEIFDYDFLSFISRHPKLQPQNAVQILDLLAKHQLSDVCNAGAAQIPFIQICAHYLPNEHSCYDFLVKFITICLNQLLQIENALQSDVRSSIQKNKILALPAPGRSGSRGGSKQNDPNVGGKDFIIHGSKKSNSSQKQRMIALNPEESVNHRLKRSHILNILFKIQNLRLNEINEEMKNIILGAQRQYKNQNDIPHAGMQALLRYWGEPEAIYQQYNQSLGLDQERSSLDNLDQVKRQSKNDRKMLNYDSEGSQTNMHLAPYDPKKQKGTTRKLSGVIAISENTNNYRALQELELKKKQRLDKQLEDQKKVEAENKKKTLADNKLKEEIAKKRIQQGILPKVGGVQQEIKAIIQDPKETEKNKLFRNTMPKQVQLVNLADEEDRDQEMVSAFMKKYSKIWKFLFGRYANQMYSIKGRENFDDLKKNTSQISLPEVLKMIKEHDIYPQLISKDELSCLFRLINSQTQQANSNDILMLDFLQFVQLIPQLAFVCYSRPPVDKSALPPIFMLQAFIGQLEQANRDRGKPTGIYEDPDMSNFADKELIKALEIKVNKDPSYPVPEGYKKVLEKTPIFQYSLPQCAKSVLDPEKIIATELLDEILNKALQIHFLEPLVSFETKYKVKSQINRSSKPPTSDTVNYMKKVEKIIDEKKQLGTAFANMSAAEKRNLSLEVKPQLSLALKLQVTKQDLKNRPNYQEVAEVLEEMLIAVDKGLDYLPPRQTKVPGQYVNEAKRLKEEKELEAAELEKQRELQRQKRDAEAKKLIQETQFGGKNMPTKKFRALKAQVEMEEKEKLEKEERKKFQQQTEKERKRIDEIKQKQLEEIEKKKQEDRSKEEAEKKTADEIRKKFLAQQKGKLTQEFKDNIKKRDVLIQKKEEAKKIEKDSEDYLKEQMNKYIQDTKEDRVGEKQEREAVNAFLESELVKQIFQLYDKPLNNMFKFYSNQDSKKDMIAFDAGILANTLSFKELVRFNYQQQITPQFITPEDVVHIHKTIVRETVDEEKRKPEDQRNPKKLDYIDFNQFKRALVRIAVLAQEKLGVGNEDMLKKKLEEDSKTILQEKIKKEALLKQMTDKDEKKKNQLDDLRNKYQEEKQQKDSILSRKAADKKPHEANTLQQKQKDELKQYQLDQGKLAQEEQFFQKWLKQRENLGVKEDEDIADVKTKLSTKKDAVQHEIDLLEAKKKDKQRQLSLKVEQKQIRKKFDINIINVDTIEALFQYLELDLPERDASRRLTLLNDSRKQTISNKAIGLNSYDSQVSLRPGDTLPKNTPAKQLNEIKEQPSFARKDSAIFDRQSALTKNTKQNENAPPSQLDRTANASSPIKENGLNKNGSLSKLDQSRNSISKQDVASPIRAGSIQNSPTRGDSVKK